MFLQLCWHWSRCVFVLRFLSSAPPTSHWSRRIGACSARSICSGSPSRCHTVHPRPFSSNFFAWRVSRLTVLSSRRYPRDGLMPTSCRHSFRVDSIAPSLPDSHLARVPLTSIHSFLSDCAYLKTLSWSTENLGCSGIPPCGHSGSRSSRFGSMLLSWGSC